MESNMHNSRRFTLLVTCLAAGVFLAAGQVIGCNGDDSGAMSAAPDGASSTEDGSPESGDDATLEADTTSNETSATDAPARQADAADGDATVEVSPMDGNGPVPADGPSGDSAMDGAIADALADAGDGATHTDAGDGATHADAGDGAIVDALADAGDGATVDAQGDASNESGGVDTISILRAAQGASCVACALATDAGPSCLSQYNCEALADAGASRQAHCYETLQCEVQSNCASAATTDCYCGVASFLACETEAGAANGACAAQERVGLETTNPADLLVTSFFLPTLGAGVANALVDCLGGANCDCFGGH
jgi:hypothetical protein